MSKRVIKYEYKIAEELYHFVNQEILPGLIIEQEKFWQAATDILTQFIPRNLALLEKREMLQGKIDDWHVAQQNQPFCQEKYQEFLQEIGYIVEEQADFHISTDKVDREVALVAGPQLVVPLMNARFALNAANARWGSLYDALYGTDVIAQDNGAQITKSYNPVRGRRVQSYAKRFLDKILPLAQDSHINAICYQVVEQQLLVILQSGLQVKLAQPEQFVGFVGDLDKPSSILCCHNGLHVDIQVDRHHLVGKTDNAGIKDITLESALTTIQDCEDSIAAVDAHDKIIVYRNWLGLMKGDLTATVNKNGKEIIRALNPDRHYLTPLQQPMTLSGRSLQFIRNVGHLMTTDAILTLENQEVPEGIVDALMTSLISLHDIAGHSLYRNSREGSIYIVKPKMHGPEEVKFSHDLFSAVESCLLLPKNTIKMGIMDEERRTSVNLKECIRAAKDRIAFINTGFLDRTGDEIHTSMLAGPMVRKDLMKNELWIKAYESRNVRIGLKAGFQGKAQIGKGMWAIPDEMSAMMKSKIDHPKSGASCAWVPSPTAATLHAMHYHYVNVTGIQLSMQKLFDVSEASGHSDELVELLTIPLLHNVDDLSPDDIQQELDNNIQGLLGYVVRWVDQGIGCSKVLDINDIDRMEDRATLRISSQHVANWLHHGIVTKAQIKESLRRMAVVVDKQNSNDRNYKPMLKEFDTSITFQAASDLILTAKVQPSGYTEPLLHRSRLLIKNKL